MGQITSLPKKKAELVKTIQNRFITTLKLKSAWINTLNICIDVIQNNTYFSDLQACRELLHNSDLTLIIPWEKKSKYHFHLTYEETQA